MADQKPCRGPPNSNVHAVGLQQPSQMLHKYFILVCAPYIACYHKLIGVQAAPEYLSDTLHTYKQCSEVSACSVEPGSAEDVSKIVSHPTSLRWLLLTHINYSYVS